MKKFYKALLVIFIIVSLLILFHHINVKLDVAKIPPRFFTTQVAESKVEHLNFDENNSPNVVNLLSNEQKYSGGQSLKITPENDFLDLFEYYLDEKNQNEYLNSVRLDLMVFAEQQFTEVVVVVEVTDFTGKLVQWQNLLINPSVLNTWEHIYYSVYLNTESRKPNNKIKVFLWNLTKEKFYVDDFRVAIRRSDTEPVVKNALVLKSYNQPLGRDQIAIYGDLLRTTDSSNYFLHISSDVLFTPPFKVDFETVSSNILPSKINVSFKFDPINLHENVKFAIEFKNKETQNRTFYYFQLPNYYSRGEERCSFDIEIPEEYRYNGEMLAYIWNIGGNEFNIEELKYVFF